MAALAACRDFAAQTWTTSTQLLQGLLDSRNSIAWKEFHERYEPIILGVARRCGLSDADAADVVQETLTQFLKDYQAGKYSRERGRLRAWLIGILRRRVADLRRWRVGRRELHADSDVLETPTVDEVDELWEQERRHTLLQRALGELRQSPRIGHNTVEAFERIVLREERPAEVAQQLGMTLGDVYTAKSRVTEKLRAIIERLEHEDGEN
jgi:RNA polymerase sigma-70 factor (ECF subfamily)